MSDTKTLTLLQLLRDDWISANDLCARFSWESNTLRGALSTLAKKQGLKIERRREYGLTSYRTAEPTATPANRTDPSVAELTA